jgi:hypothetical protein
MNAANYHQKINSYFKKIDSRIKKNHQLLWEKYVQLGSQAVKLVCYSQDFIPLIEKQLSYSLKDRAENCVATIVVWQEKLVEEFFDNLMDDHARSRLRVQQSAFKNEDFLLQISQAIDSQSKIITKINSVNGAINSFEIVDETYSKHSPLISVNVNGGIITAYDRSNKIYYYGVKDLHPEEFIKQGHIFVQIFNKILKTANTNLVHGAVVVWITREFCCVVAAKEVSQL